MQDRRRLDGERGRHEAVVELEAGGGGAANACERYGQKLIARFTMGDQLDAGFQERNVGFGCVREVIRDRRLFADIARDKPRVAIGRVVRAGFTQRMQRQIERKFIDAVGQRVERDGRRQIVGLRRGVQRAVRKHQRQFAHPQHIAAERIAVELNRAHAPVVRLNGLNRFEQARLMICVLTLKMLRPQKQAFPPEHLCGITHLKPVICVKRVACPMIIVSGPAIVKSSNTVKLPFKCIFSHNSPKTAYSAIEPGIPVQVGSQSRWSPSLHSYADRS